METSILKSTKKILGLTDSYTVYDHDVITFINSAFFNLNQLGVGPDDGFSIEDETSKWEDFVLLSGTDQSLQAVKTYVFLKVKMHFDPPGTSFLIEAMNKQIEELEWRLNVAREYALPEEVA